MADRADSLNVIEIKLPNGATVVDAGIKATGSLEAGRLMGEACLAGCGSVGWTEIHFGDEVHPGVRVVVDRPKAGCMASQYAGWAVSLDDDGAGSPYFAMGSGPARALYGHEPIFEHLGYAESADEAAIIFEGSKLPTEAVAEKVARDCGVTPENLCMLIAPTASLAGSVQIAARVVETGLHKLHELGFDLDAVLSGYGTCPVPPVAKSDLRAIGRTNDAVLYGGTVWYAVDCEDADVERIIERVPSSSSKDYGTLFYDLFKRYDGDFYKIDPMLFSPARVIVNNVRSGRVFTAGRLDGEMYMRSCAS
ncbi:Methenyltetrahydromethanopterin cyclohydrolase [Pseudodesulfovibrio hydrargyri]|uniref:Methenyltetrahydromethanopterin cyclohydrolase n=2 Tax=Pseudodesulfovibrio hydrargyri TaxID=2125990 RepID=A0A1J5MYL1_9BACT|nr:Methenyltetrahydromethanopterin cyclohydrolase [Pseudodesulfovibrio hydrargyri]